MESAVKTFTGSHNTYAFVAKKYTDQLGLSMQYAQHPLAGTGCILTRFVLQADGDVELKTFKIRHEPVPAKFTNEDGTEFTAKRLNRVAIPVFQPGPNPMSFITMAEKFLLWDVLSDWVKERCVENGFEVVDNLKEIIKNLVVGNFAVNDENYKFILTFPDFNQGE